MGTLSLATPSPPNMLVTLVYMEQQNKHLEKEEMHREWEVQHMELQEHMVELAECSIGLQAQHQGDLMLLLQATLIGMGAGDA
jgi:hypothetical protein